jgi:tetratricopeptide (TPR) repeat protein
MTDQPGARGLDPETLAAYVDGRLPPEARARVDAVIAADPDHYEWLVQTLRAVDQPDAAAPEPPAALPAVAALPPRRGRAALVGIGVLLTAAAAAWVLLPIGRSTTAPDDGVPSLVAAVGEERYFDARLTGGFRYGPVRPVMRGPGDTSNVSLDVLAAAGAVQQAALADVSLGRLHAWGAAQLLIGDFDGAVTTLAQAAGRAGAPAAAHSDLAASLLTRGVRRGASDDITAALAAADRAIAESSPALEEALFNRALALERLGRPEAAEAWRRAAEGSADPAWASEARRRASAGDR